jgi:cupin 2 domain-containing protein
VRKTNLLHETDPPDTGERFETIGQLGSVDIERIVSSALPDLREYDQAHDEWVLLVRGTARLEIADDEIDLVAGDYVLLPAHARHRVLETSEGALWLALHDRAARGVHRVHLATEDGDLLTAFLSLDADGRLVRAPAPHLVKATFRDEVYLGEFERGDARWNRIAWANGETSFTDLAIAPLRRYATVRLYDEGTDPLDPYSYLVREIRRV